MGFSEGRSQTPSSLISYGGSLNLASHFGGCFGVGSPSPRPGWVSELWESAFCRWASQPQYKITNQKMARSYFLPLKSTIAPSFDYDCFTAIVFGNSGSGEVD